VDDVRGSDIAPRLPALLKQRAERAGLHGIKGVDDGTRQAKQDVQAEFVTRGN
jgi:hypothetical protein